jgi:hypothetical protein
MVGLLLTGLIAIGVLGVAIFVVVSQPRPVWEDVAEHAKSFWYSWALIAAIVGVAPAIAGLWSAWANAVWLAVCCAFGALQPAMIADILDVRSDIVRRRQSTLAARQRGEQDDAAATVNVPKGG